MVPSFTPWKLLFFSLISLSLNAQSFRQTQEDSYTRYELLDPASQSFRIIYDVSATAVGAPFYFNTLRKGSEHTVDAVYDRASGQTLEWKIVDGVTALKNGLQYANSEVEYLQVSLPRPVPQNGAIRIRIDKTYKDPASYYEENGTITFDRSLGIQRNSVVLPASYELLSCNYPSQVETLDDGRIKLSFMNRGAAPVPYKITGKYSQTMSKAPSKIVEAPWPDYDAKPSGRDKSHARLDFNFSERAFQNREIVYYLQQPETHDFRLYHDYTETRPGVDKYLNIVRAGSKASDPSAYILDTGEELKVETLKGSAITDAGISLSTPPSPETEVIAIWFDPVKPGTSTRLRIWETYTDPNRYLLHNNELIWDRSFGRNRNEVVMPSGWYLVQSSIPAIIKTTSEGLVHLTFWNDRPDNIDVHLVGRRH
ncbi:MAG: hypothetical protein Sapg2KO_36300 [Saprospiraceae bacterium]